MFDLESLKQLEGTEFGERENFSIVSREEAVDIIIEQLNYLKDYYEEAANLVSISTHFKLGHFLTGPKGKNTVYFSPEEVNFLLENVSITMSNSELQHLLNVISAGPLIEEAFNEVIEQGGSFLGAFSKLF